MRMLETCMNAGASQNMLLMPVIPTTIKGVNPFYIHQVKPKKKKRRLHTVYTINKEVHQVKSESSHNN